MGGNYRVHSMIIVTFRLSILASIRTNVMLLIIIKSSQAQVDYPYLHPYPILVILVLFF